MNGARKKGMIFCWQLLGHIPAGLSMCHFCVTEAEAVCQLFPWNDPYTAC